MSKDRDNTHQPATLAAQDFEELPVEQLRQVAIELGLPADDKAGEQQLMGAIRRRREMIQELDRGAMLEVLAWARRTAPATAGKEDLARQIAAIRKWNYHRLSHRGLVTLALLRGICVEPEDSAEKIIHALRGQGSLREHLRHKRRAWVASLIGRVIGSHHEPDSLARTNDQAAPPPGDVKKLKAEIVQHGVVRGLASTIRNATDDYIQQKLDEIEARIDRKLDEIDRRLQEWRDREIVNRLRIIKITLVASILVAVLSFGYSRVKWHVVQAGAESQAPAGTSGQDGAKTAPGPQEKR
jgi:hypothetical protein